jgi:hypothetical protein
VYDSITELMDACVRELRKTNKLDTTDLTVEQASESGSGGVVVYACVYVWVCMCVLGGITTALPANGRPTATPTAESTAA